MLRLLADHPAADDHVLADRDRLAALAATGALARGEDGALSRFARLACETTGAVAGFVTLVDATTAHFVAWERADGSPLPAALRTRPIGETLCRELVVRAETFVVTDGEADPRTRDSVAVRRDGVRAYAGTPVRSRDGHVLGGVCVVGFEPREFGPEQIAVLADLACAVEANLRLHAAGLELGLAAGGSSTLPAGEGYLLGRLRGATARGDLRLVHQPIVDLRTGRTVSVEALVRWTDAELGPVGPDRFIPAAERHGLMGPIGTWILAAAIDEAAILAELSDEPPSVAVNLSPLQLADPGLLSLVRSLLDAAGVPPHRISFELTETALLDEDPVTLGVLRGLDALGCRLALDDFGTGFSSLSHLRLLPISRVKIDRSFIAGLATDFESTMIVAAVNGLASALDLDVTAEGVETELQASALSRLGCRHAQGWHFDRPLEAVQLRARVAEGHPPSV